MSLLPQRKKSAEEIAKLRETLGIPGQSPEDELPAEIEAPVPVAANEPRVEASIPISNKIPQPAPTSSLAPIPVPEVQPAKQVSSLRRSERIPVLPVDDHEILDYVLSQAERPEIPATSPLPVAHGPKQVRSLRKSEQGPLPAISRLEPSPDSKLPFQRHSDREISEIRRQEAIAMLAPPVHPQSLTAHPALVVPGYLFALAGAACFYYYELQLPYTAVCVVFSLMFAAFIFYKKPLSRHHAAFIAVAALFVIVFGALYYFPTLRHGT
ncbi:MAG: hypothetical protein ABIS50_12980 [Luteolibacter sp.]|uniref:hypothetical protein n=1 Tax=Luteolibacter sp. TaxID=1962973 RepID=UPI0032630839